MIHNIRLGHACNSSSTHTIVPAAQLTGGGADLYGERQYGWEWFQLLTEEEKMDYLAVLLKHQLDGEVIAEITGRPAPKTEGYDEYIDHQSAREMPANFREEFVRDLAEWLKRPEVAILGGNDNSDRADYGHENVTPFDLPIHRETTAPLARPDTAPDGSRYWTVYYPNSGSKARFSFDAMPIQGEGGERSIAYGGLPELVDLKVTAFCPFEKDCPWCYQDSTTEGKHASKAAVGRALKECKVAGVFEIAIGGGEPTLWPHLDWLSNEAQRFGITLNMTTKNFAWIRRKDSRATLERMGAIALSVNSEKDLERFESLWAAHGDNGTVSNILTTWRATWREPLPQVEVTIQCIPAVLEPALLQRIVDAAEERNMRITFLGFKRTGRAGEVPENLKWVDALKGKKRWWLQSRVAVDTIMAEEARPLFEAADIDPVYYGTDEGAFSCYIDAVTGKLAPSSYAPPVQYLELSDDLGTVFRAAQKTAGLR